MDVKGCAWVCIIAAVNARSRKWKEGMTIYQKDHRLLEEAPSTDPAHTLCLNKHLMTTKPHTQTTKAYQWVHTALCFKALSRSDVDLTLSFNSPSYTVGSERCGWMGMREWCRQRSQDQRSSLKHLQKSSLVSQQSGFAFKEWADYRVIAITIVQCEKNPPLQSLSDTKTQ